MNDIARPAIAMRPERALRAYFPIRIIDSLFMRATDDTIRHYDRLGCVTLNEFENLKLDRWIFPNVAFFGEQALHDGLGALSGHNSNCYFAGSLVIRSVESDCGDRVALKATPGLFLQW